MGSGASKAQKAARHYPPASNIAKSSPVPPPRPRAPFPEQSRPNHPADVAAKLGGTSIPKFRDGPSGAPEGMDLQLAKRLQQLGPVSVQHPELKPAGKFENEMGTILQNRARISQTLQEEMDNTAVPLKQHAQIAHIKEIVQSVQKGRDPERISREFKVHPSVIQKLSGYYAVPVDNADGIGEWPNKK